MASRAVGGLRPGRVLRLVAGMPVAAGLWRTLLGGLRPVGRVVSNITSARMYRPRETLTHSITSLTWWCTAEAGGVRYISGAGYTGCAGGVWYAVLWFALGNK